MEFIPLHPEQKQAFDNDGFLVVRQALDRQTIEHIIEAGDRKAVAFLGKGKILNKPWYNDLDLRPSLLEEKAIYDLVAHPTVSLVVQLMTPNIHLHSIALTYKRPENPDLPPFRRGWHRDIRIPRDLGHQQLPRVGVKICYCLTDFDQPDSGITIMARRSHLRQESLKIPKGEIDPPDVDVCDLKLKAGDALLFENRIFHTATPNRHNKVAKRIILGYAYRWMKQEIYLDQLDNQFMQSADPITRQLLGWYRDIDTPPWALQDWAKQHKVLPPPVPWFEMV